MASTQTKVYDVVRKSIDCFYEMRNMYDLKKINTVSHCVYTNDQNQQNYEKSIDGNRILFLVS